MPLAGKELMPRDIAKEARPYWRNYELTKAVATALAESAGYIGAYNDNDNGTRDCGEMQINISASEVGTSVEDSLRTESLDPAVYTPILKHNMKRAFELYSQPWKRNGESDIRRFQPWVAYTTGWATFTSWWVWHQDVDHNPIGPWVKTGRYIQRAIPGQINNLIINEKIWTPEEGLGYAQSYAEYFGVEGTLGLSKAGVVIWTQVPRAPTAPPKDGIGPRPIANDGV